MPRVACINKIKPECVARFAQVHGNLSPAMRAALHDAGWLNYSAFLGADGHFVVYLEPPVDLRTAQKALGANPAFVRWFEEFGDCFEAPDPARPDVMLIELEEILHLD